MSFLSEAVNYVESIVNDSESSNECNDVHVEPNMISAYQCDVHREHADDDQTMLLPEFVAPGNSKFGMSANDLKDRMPCCDSSKLLQSTREMQMGDTSAFPPYCCKTAGPSCPGKYSVSFSYVASEPFNGVCYADGIHVHKVIAPIESTPRVSSLPANGNGHTVSLHKIVLICTCVFFVCMYVYLQVHWRRVRHKRARVMKRLIRGLEAIDEV